MILIICYRGFDCGIIMDGGIKYTMKKKYYICWRIWIQYQKEKNKAADEIFSKEGTNTNKKNGSKKITIANHQHQEHQQQPSKQIQASSSISTDTDRYKR
jgi:hypothetical protein